MNPESSKKSIHTQIHHNKIARNPEQKEQNFQAAKECRKPRAKRTKFSSCKGVTDFIGAMEGKRQQKDGMYMLKESNFKPRILYPIKIPT